MPYVCDVVVVIQEVKGFLQVLDIFFISELHISLGNHGNLRFHHGNASCFQSFPHSAEIIRRGEHFIAVLFLGKVFCACVQSRHHQLVRVHLTLFFVDDDLAFLIEHEGNASLGSNASVTLGKGVPYVAGGTVLIVCKSLYDYSDAVGAVAFVGCALVIVRGIRPGSLLDTSLNRIVRHVVGLRLGDHIAELAVIVRVRTARLDSHNDLTSDHGKDLALLGVVLLLFMLYVREF